MDNKANEPSLNTAKFYHVPLPPNLEYDKHLNLTNYVDSGMYNVEAIEASLPVLNGVDQNYVDEYSLEYKNNYIPGYTKRDENVAEYYDNFYTPEFISNSFGLILDTNTRALFEIPSTTATPYSESSLNHHVVETIKNSEILNIYRTAGKDLQYGGALRNFSNVISNTTTTNETEQIFLSSNTSSLCGFDFTETGNKLYLYGLALLIAIAILFNGLQFAVFNTKALRRYAFSTFLIAASVVDSLSLLSHIPRRWMNLAYGKTGMDVHSTLYDGNPIACRGLTFLSYTARFASAWIIVALAIERLVVSKDPYRKSLMRRPGTAYKQLLAIIIVSLFTNCHVIFTWNLVAKDKVTQCAPSIRSESLETFLTILSIILIVALPFFLTLILSFMIIQNLHSKIWKVRPRKISASIQRKIRLERRATLMVAIVTGMHALLSLPYTVSWLVLLGQYYSTAVHACAYERTYAVRDVTEIVYMTNYTVKFLFCLFCGMNVVSHK